MLPEYPANTIWYLQSWTGEKIDLSEGSAVAIRLQKKGEPKTAETYLLTCAHVVRGESGGTRIIRAWPPLVAYTDQQAKTVSVDPEFKELPTEKPSEEERRNATDDWIILRVENPGSIAAAPAIKNWMSNVAQGNFLICGYPAGKDSFNKDIVSPTLMQDEFPFRDLEQGVICLTGDATKAGVSGGGVFWEASRQFAGIHRGRFDAALQIYAVSASHIFNILNERGYEVVTRGADDPTRDSALRPIDLEPFIAEIVKQLSSEPPVLARLEALFRARDLKIEKSQLGAAATPVQSRADALARTLIERDFSDVSDVMKDAVEECTTANEVHQRQVLFTVLCWFLPAYDPQKAEKLREAYEKGEVHLIEVDVASALAAELIVSAMQRRRASIDGDKGVSSLPGQSLPLGLGATAEEEIIETVERWLIGLLEFGSDYDMPPAVYRPSIQKILPGLRGPGKSLPYIVFSITSLKAGLKREDLETISAAIRGVYPTLATLILSNDEQVHSVEPARLFSLRQILKGFHR
jgi:hypothetical protein